METFQFICISVVPHDHTGLFKTGAMRDIFLLWKRIILCKENDSKYLLNEHYNNNDRGSSVRREQTKPIDKAIPRNVTELATNFP